MRKAKSAGLRVGILSNELELLYDRETIERLDILKLMDCVIDATHTEILKPDSRAYATGCEAMGLPPSQIVFVDDQQRNVDGARKAGLWVVRFDVTRPAESYGEAERLLGVVSFGGVLAPYHRPWPIGGADYRATCADKISAKDRRRCSSDRRARC